MLGAIFPKKKAPAPKPITARSVTRPRLSGNQRIRVALGVTWPKTIIQGGDHARTKIRESYASFVINDYRFIFSQNPTGRWGSLLKNFRRSSLTAQTLYSGISPVDPKRDWKLVDGRFRKVEIHKIVPSGLLGVTLALACNVPRRDVTLPFSFTDIKFIGIGRIYFDHFLDSARGANRSAGHCAGVVMIKNTARGKNQGEIGVRQLPAQCNQWHGKDRALVKICLCAKILFLCAHVWGRATAGLLSPGVGR